MYWHHQSEISRLLDKIISVLDRPFYLSTEFWAIVVALVLGIVVPILSEWLSRMPRKSKLIFAGIKAINQENEPIEGNIQPKVLDVVRVAITNEGRFKAVNVEASIEKIIDKDGERQNFVPVPLIWTHGQILQNISARDIYPHQTVYLDVLYHAYDEGVVNNRIVYLAVPIGKEVENLSRLALENSELTIKLYQESGQVNTVVLDVVWDGYSVPEVSIKSES